jgi:ankyrin repeat protein
VSLPSGKHDDRMVRILLDAGADARRQTRGVQSAMAVACYNRHPSIVQMLINHDNGILEIASPNGWTLLLQAAQRGSVDTVRLLLDCGANVSAADRDCQTALMLACFDAHLVVVRLLLAAGSDLEHRDKNQQTAMHHAATYGRIEIVR